MIRSYDALVLRLKRAGVVPKKHVLDNKVSEAMKNHIRDDLKCIDLFMSACLLHCEDGADSIPHQFKLIQRTPPVGASAAIY